MPVTLDWLDVSDCTSFWQSFVPRAASVEQRLGAPATAPKMSAASRGPAFATRPGCHCADWHEQAVGADWACGVQPDRCEEGWRAVPRPGRAPSPAPAYDVIMANSQCTSLMRGSSSPPPSPAPRPAMTSPSGPAVTGTASPSCTSPASSICASGSCRWRWIARLSGRAP